MRTSTYFILSFLFLAESYVIKGISNKFDESNLFNNTIQKNLKMVGQAQSNVPTVALTNPSASSTMIFKGNFIHTRVSATIGIKENTGFESSLQFPMPADTDMIIVDGLYDSAKKVFVSTEIKIDVNNEALASMNMIVFKQKNPPTYVLTGVAYAVPDKKQQKGTSSTANAVSVLPTPAAALGSPDFEISLVDNKKPKTSGQLEFTKKDATYVADFDVTIKVTHKKTGENDNLNGISLKFMLSSMMGVGNVVYKLVNPASGANPECALSFPTAPPKENLSKNVPTGLGTASYNVITCSYANFDKGTTKEHKITGSVSSAKPLSNGTMLVFGLSVTLDGKVGNTPWAYSLSSSTSGNLIPSSTGNSTSKKLSGGAIAGIIIGSLLGVGLVIGIIVFVIKKKGSD